MPIKILPANRGGNPSFAGWGTATWASLVLNNMQFVGSIDFDSTRIFIAGGNGGAANNCLRFSTKASPTVYTIPTYPVSDDLGGMCCMGDNDTLMTVTTTGALNVRAYRYVVSTNTFTNMNFPESGQHDSLTFCLRDPRSTDIVYIGTGSAVASGQASIWKLELSTATWTELIAFAGVGGHAVRWACFDPSSYEMYAGTGHFTAGGNSRLWRSTNPGYTAFTQIAGDGINGSWTAGTKRGAFPYFNAQNGYLYAGLNGAAGDGDFWRSRDHGQSWTQIGGDGLNSGWAAGTFTAAARCATLANKITVGTAGAAGDAEVWQFDELTSLWTKIAGDSLSGSWNNTKTGVFMLMIDPATNTLYAGGGNNTVNTSFFYNVVAGGPFNGGSNGFSYQPYPVFAMFGGGQ